MLTFWRWVFDLNVYADKLTLIKYIVFLKINPLVFLNGFINGKQRSRYGNTTSLKKGSDKIKSRSWN